MPEEPQTNLQVAERVASLLAAEGLQALVIGAVALAAHRYVRFTEDIDLGVNADLIQMQRLTDKLCTEGYDAEFRRPDGDDPLGGVIDVSGSFGLVQVISFDGKFPAAIRDALQGEDLRVRPGSPLRIAPIPQLVALKLYAGGWSSRADILELLRRNPETDLESLSKICRNYRLQGLGGIIKELIKDS